MVHRKFEDIKFLNLDQGCYFGITDIIYSAVRDLDDKMDLENWFNFRENIKRFATVISETDTTLLMLPLTDLMLM